MSDSLDKIIRARVQLQKENPFFSYVCMHLTLKESKEVPSMGVDAYGHCYYNEDFVKTLTGEQVKGVLCHEIMHVILEHLKRGGLRDHYVSNVAQDIVVNDLLVTNDFELPKCGIIPRNHCVDLPLAPGKVLTIKNINQKVWEEVYDEIEKVVPKIKVQLSFGDQHIRDGKPDNQDGEGKGKDGEVKTLKVKGKDDDGKDTPGDKKKKEEEGEGAGKKEEKNWKQITTEAYSYAKMQGKTPAGMDRYVEELNYPKLNWRQLLQKFIVQEIPYDYSYSRPSKKSIAAGIYMPSIRKEQLEIAVAVDTSGSMCDKDLQDCLSEVMGIVTAYENVNLTVLTCDAEVHTVNEVTATTDVKSIKMQGGGGTDFRPVFKWLEENKSQLKLLIFFTDGYGDFPKEQTVRTLWVLSKDGIKNDDVPFGEVVRVVNRRDEDE